MWISKDINKVFRTKQEKSKGKGWMGTFRALWDGIIIIN